MSQRQTASPYGLHSISQTEGKALPTLTEVQGDVNGYRHKRVYILQCSHYRAHE
jgi:hypothetical protein